MIIQTTQPVINAWRQVVFEQGQRLTVASDHGSFYFAHAAKGDIARMVPKEECRVVVSHAEMLRLQ